MAADDGSSQETQFGSPPNNIYKNSHDGGVTSEIDDETPVETVEKLLGDAPNVASSSTPTSIDLRSFFDNSLRSKCKLRYPWDTAYPCPFESFSSLQNSGRHLMYDHIFDELSKIRWGELDVDHAELLISQERVRRAEKYEWVCPVPGCIMASLRRYEVENHIDQMHGHGIPTASRRRERGLKAKNLADAVMDILAAD